MKQIQIDEEVHKKLMIAKILNNYKSVSDTIYYALQALEETKHDLQDNNRTEF